MKKDYFQKKAYAFYLLSFFLFTTLFFISPPKTEANSCSWIGGTGTNVSTAANWSNCTTGIEN
jgi:hypothetical protein